ncbi:unknown protein [Cronobacter turicensis z3032]|uniref:Uncharacterized protein n=1 Tax=Cronobacter turicensis (strain DSM 18703 / CCUG 55852 / LMG 23827 / z3032) TaxID=693216 RepID=C9XV16_CROTZ|nr:unknown protein [Cronobacter turicensis z3032]
MSGSAGCSLCVVNLISPRFSSFSASIHKNDKQLVVLLPAGTAAYGYAGGFLLSAIVTRTLLSQE